MINIASQTPLIVSKTKDEIAKTRILTYVHGHVALTTVVPEPFVDSLNNGYQSLFQFR